MTKTEILNALNLRNKGAWFNTRIVSDIKLSAAAKAAGHTAQKVSKMTVRYGINYMNQKHVIAKAEIDDKCLTHKLPWGEWDEEHKGVLINHKGSVYLRLYTSPNKNKTQYYLDGKEVTYDELKNSGLVLASYFKSSGEKPDAMTINIQNIQAIW